MAETVTVIGNTRALTPTGGVTANVGNVATKTNTFHVVNASTTVYAYVGVFNSWSQANKTDHPSVGSDAGGIILTPNESMIIQGNFGTAALATGGNVYVAAITATGSTSVFFTPIAP